MRQILFILFMLQCSSVFSQQKLFHLYTDSATLLTDAVIIKNQFQKDIDKLVPKLSFKVSVVVNTTPYLIFVDKGVINIPYWNDVIPAQKNFFSTMGGSEKEGEEVFGLFFNGFYIVHELGHHFFHSINRQFDNQYNSEYDANVTAVLYWRKTGYHQQLEKCYYHAKKMLSILENPIPSGEDPKQYLTKNYDQLSADPYKYGFIQFSQFVEIYEDKTLPGFDKFISSYVKK